MMLIAVPTVSAEPVSNTQETLAPSTFQVQVSPTVFETPEAPPEAPNWYGTASWYSERDPSINLHTANGDRFDDSKLTCASWQFPFGTRLKITNLENGKSITCVVNDRGPAKRLGRLIDLTLGAFRRIANPQQGLIDVSITAVQS